MENQLLPISLSETQEPSASADKLIREWLFRFGVEHKEDIAPRLPLWLEAFAGMDAEILQELFRRALKTCKFFPKVSEILEPIRRVEEVATPQAAEEEWERVLELRRLYWNPDMPGGFFRGMPRLSEHVQQAARTAGVWRDFESVEALHTWAKKRFIESYIAYGELEQDGFLLPDGEIKRLLAGVSQTKALAAPQESFADLHERGLEYAEKLNEAAPVLALNRSVPGRVFASDAERQRAILSLQEKETNPDLLERARRQKAALEERIAAGFFPPRTHSETTAVNPPELQPAEVSA